MADEAPRFNTHLLTMEEVWFVRDNPTHLRVVKVRGLVSLVEELENELEEARSKLEQATKLMNARRTAKGWG